MFTSSKSTTADFYSLIIKNLDYLLNEQKAQRADLAELLRYAHKKYTYYERPQKTLEEYETSHQTDDEDKEPD